MMNKQMLIIGGYGKGSVEQRESYYDKYVDFFEKSVSNLSEEYKVKVTYMEDLFIRIFSNEISIFDTRNNESLNENNLIFVRVAGLRKDLDILKAITEYCNLNNIKLVNNYSLVRNNSKLLQSVNFVKAHVPFVDTTMLNSALLNNKDLLPYSFPFIMKDTLGSHGNNNYLVKNWSEIENIYKNNIDKKFILQKFIENDGDYRILIIGNKSIVIHRKTISDSHLNNTSQGGIAKLIKDFRTDIIDDSKKIMKLVDLTVAGVDVIIDKNSHKYYFLEVNSQPQLMTGAFVEQKEELINNFIRELNN